MKRIAPYRASGPVLVAVVVSTAGTATAAGLIRSSKIKGNTIRSKGRPEPLAARHGLQAGPAAGRPAGLDRPAGATGARWATGAAGRDGFGLLAYPSQSDLLANGSSTNLTADCPAGTFVTGGDGRAFDDVTYVRHR